MEWWSISAGRTPWRRCMRRQVQFPSFWLPKNRSNCEDASHFTRCDGALLAPQSYHGLHPTLARLFARSRLNCHRFRLCLPLYPTHDRCKIDRFIGVERRLRVRACDGGCKPQGKLRPRPGSQVAAGLSKKPQLKRPHKCTDDRAGFLTINYGEMQCVSSHLSARMAMPFRVI